MKEFLINVLKGAVIGSSMLVPGVSGGTTALILGIYDRLIDAVSNIFKDFKRNFTYLLSLAIGGIIGLLLFAQALRTLLNSFEIPMTYFFIGIVLASIPLLIRKCKGVKFNFKTIICPIIGILIIVGISLLPSNADFTFHTDFGGYMMMLLNGIIIAVAFVLPGISISYVLLVLGIYDKFLESVATFNLSFLLPIALFSLIGLILTIKLLDFLISKHPKVAYLVILGFIIGSIAVIFPGLPQGMEILYSILLFIVGFASITFLTTKFGGD